MTGQDSQLQRGQDAYRRTSVAMFAAGVATFVLLYAPQPLLPLLARRFAVSAATSSLSLAVSTVTLALALLPAGWLSDSWGRTRVMAGSLFAAAALGLASAAAPDFLVLLILRALEGVALAGVPAVGMAYLSEEIHPGSLGSSIGLYIGGNALGGMSGRLIAGVVAGHGDWRLAFAVVGVVSAVCALLFARFAPPSRHQVRSVFTPRAAVASLGVHLLDPGQLRLELMGGLLMGSFVAVYNAVAFRLQAGPYHLGQSALAAIFLVYPLGSLASTLAGRLADRVGRRRALPLAVLATAGGLTVTLAHPLPLVVVGIALFTMGFFAAHSIASSWVGRRAQRAPAQASALYLTAYYLGSSVAGPLGGAAWSSGGWDDVMALALLLLGGGLVVSLQLRRIPPLAPLVGVR